MGFLDWIWSRKRAEIPEEGCAEHTLLKLVSKDDEVFGEGLAEVEAMGTGNPLALATVREAIRRRAKKRNMRFYEPAVGFTSFDGDELQHARARIVQLAQSHALLMDAERSGRLISAFTMTSRFQDVVALAYEVRDGGGLGQSQAFQLLYNQNKLAAMSRGRPSSPSEGPVSNAETVEERKPKSVTGKTRKCVGCNAVFPENGLQCSVCGSSRFIWE